MSREEQDDGLKELIIRGKERNRGDGEKENRDARLTHENLGKTDDSVLLYVGGHFKSGQAGPGQNRPVIL